MSADTTTGTGATPMGRRRIWLLLVPAVVGAVVAAAVSAWMPVRYQSQATLVVVPQQVASDYAPSTLMPVDERVQIIARQILSRTRLERIISDMNLFADVRRTALMEDVIEQMRQGIELVVEGAGSGGAFTVSFSGPDPQTTMQVTNRIAVLFIEEHLRDRENLSHSGVQFAESQIEDLKKRLTVHEAQMQAAGGKPSTADAIEYEVLRDKYRALLTKREELRMHNNLERRQAGEQFKLMSQARLPERPIGPTRLQVQLAGTGAGLAVGVVLLIQSFRRRRVAPAA